jgi:16S rRNA (guanine(966)-N(2))-methyltransferase RsmD
MRVTGGTLGGRRLRAPPAGVRPSSDRLRESLFAVLGDLTGNAVLDLYAGTGALGIEALSRGACEVIFVERAPRSLAVLNENLEALALEPRCRVLREDAPRAVRRLGREGRRFGLVLLDPPYGSGEDERALEAIVAAGVLTPQGVVVVERSRRHLLSPVAGLECIDQRRYGDTVVDRFSASLQVSGPTPGTAGARSAGAPDRASKAAARKQAPYASASKRTPKGSGGTKRR